MIKSIDNYKGTGTNNLYLSQVRRNDKKFWEGLVVYYKMPVN